jgi:DNA-binding transcriptional regulator YiaG
MTSTEIKQLRTRLRMSVADCARQVEVNQRTWSRWESGDRKMPAGMVKLFKLLNGVKA